MTERTLKITLNKNQTQQFARAIFSEIEKYIAAHQTEYEEFLQSEANQSEEENRI